MNYVWVGVGCFFAGAALAFGFDARLRQEIDELRGDVAVLCGNLIHAAQKDEAALRADVNAVIKKIKDLL